jgi:hypothetical protein
MNAPPRHIGDTAYDDRTDDRRVGYSYVVKDDLNADGCLRQTLEMMTHQIWPMADTSG